MLGSFNAYRFVIGITNCYMPSFDYGGNGIDMNQIQTARKKLHRNKTYRRFRGVHAHSKRVKSR